MTDRYPGVLDQARYISANYEDDRRLSELPLSADHYLRDERLTKRY